MRTCVLLILALGLAAGSLAANVTAADYARAEQLLQYNSERLVLNQVDDLQWMTRQVFWYRRRSSRGIEFIRVDASHGTRRPLFDPEALARSVSMATGQQYTAANVPLEAAEVSSDGRQLILSVDSHQWACGTGAEPCVERPDANPNEVLSPDGRLAAFIRGFNLWIRDVNSGKEVSITSDGVKDYGYATDNPGWMPSARPVLLWSPDSKRIATFQQDERGVGETYLISTQPGHSELKAWKYPMSGDEVIPKIYRVIVDVEDRRVVRFQMSPDALRSASAWGYSLALPDGKLAESIWSADSKHLAFLSNSRDRRRVQMRIADAVSGQVRDILEERVPTVYERGADNWRWLEHSHQVLWQSARDNWDHLYLYDEVSGKLLRQLTSGEWNVTEVLKVDEHRRQVFFLGVGREPGQDPYFEHLYSVSLDGGKPVLLTPENATHQISMSPDGEYFVSRYSTPQSAPVAVLRSRTGKLLQVLERADISRLLARGWQPPLSIVVKARDGVTDLYGLLYKPHDFNEMRRYPIVNAIYPGPSVGSVQGRSFVVARGMGDDHSLAELGFVVVQIDGTGTPSRSKAFQDANYGNMADNTLPDQVAGMKELARRYPWIDDTRAGIYGISGGANAAARALFDYPDFFKVGIAINGNHDLRSYTDNWGEKWMGLLERKADGTSNYDSQANQNVVQRLKGHLLLAYGTMDDNVPPNSTLVLIDSLIKANKDFDVLVLPNERHDPVGVARRYLTRRYWDYLVRYLQGTEPPREFTMHAPADAQMTGAE